MFHWEETFWCQSRNKSFLKLGSSQNTYQGLEQWNVEANGTVFKKSKNDLPEKKEEFYFLIIKKEKRESSLSG